MVDRSGGRATVNGGAAATSTAATGGYGERGLALRKRLRAGCGSRCPLLPLPDRGGQWATVVGVPCHTAVEERIQAMKTAIQEELPERSRKRIKD